MEDYSTVIKDRNGEVIRAFLNQNEQWCFPPSDSMRVPDKLAQAVLMFEDQYFYSHFGINPISSIRALTQNISSGKITSGSSTITMQVARMDKLHERTYFNKLLEVLKAIKIEVQYSKKEILSMYLNHAPYGGNIIGYQAASLKYFLKNPDQLSWAEAATFAVLPNAPALISPSKNPDHLLKKRNRLLKKLHEAGALKKETYELALLEKIPRTTYPFEQSAHHLTARLRQKQAHRVSTGKAQRHVNANEKSGRPNSAIGTTNSESNAADNRQKHLINTTLDKSIQLQIERMLKQYVNQLSAQGIQNGAAVVLDTKTGGILAYAGSQDYYDQKTLGMVDGVMANRSSGSLLKPFLFASSIDEGLITPNTLIKDIPTYYGAYSPNNYNKEFSGLVRAKDALTKSLNIPAVRLLNAYGVYPFYQFLKSAGITSLFRGSEEYGLPLIIGGAEVNLLEMAMLYQGLAHHGSFQYPYCVANEKKVTTKQLISEGACALTLDMLKQLKRPGLEYHWEAFANQQPIAWKTGTSYGHKDAWAVGVTPDYTIGVWLGNFNGNGNVNLVGTTAAGPLLFQILNRLSDQKNRSWFQVNEATLKELKICKTTGFSAGKNCTDVQFEPVPVGMKPLVLCPYHKKAEVNKDESMAVCSHCWSEGHHPKKYLQYPTDVLLQLNKKGVSPRPIPFHHINCKVGSESNQLTIVYPIDSALIWVPRDFDGAYQQLIAKAAVTDKNTRVFWYLNEAYIGETKRIHRKAIQLPIGKHTIVAKSEKGSESSASFYIVKKKQ